jgi:hypothetical protein
MPLSEPQVRHFFAFGFVKVPALFDAGEVAVLTAALESAIRREHCLPDPPTVRATVHNWWEGEPAAAFVQPHPKVLELCGQLLGDGFVGSHNGRSNDDGNLYVGDTAWHADMGWDPKIPLGRSDPLRADAAAQLVSDNAHLHMFPSIKIAFYLDPTTKETGALRMVVSAVPPPLLLLLLLLLPLLTAAAAATSRPSSLSCQPALHSDMMTDLLTHGFHGGTAATAWQP